MNLDVDQFVLISENRSKGVVRCIVLASFTARNPEKKLYVGEVNGAFFFGEFQVSASVGLKVWKR